MKAELSGELMLSKEWWEFTVIPTIEVWGGSMGDGHWFMHIDISWMFFWGGVRFTGGKGK